MLTKIDPRIKLLALIVFSITAFKAREEKLLILIAFLLLAAFLNREKLKRIFKSIWMLRWVFLFTFFLNALFTPGIDSKEVWIFYIGTEGVKKGIELCLRMFALILPPLILILSTEPADLCSAVEWFFLPLKKMKLPATSFISVFSLSFLLLAKVREEIKKFRDSSKIHGFNIGVKPAFLEWRRTFKKTSELFILFFQFINRKVIKLSEALAAKAYNQEKGLNTIKYLKIKIIDIFALTFVLFCAGLIWL